MKTKEELKAEIAQLDWMIFKFELTDSNLYIFKELIDKRNKLEAELKAINNYIPTINLLISPIAWTDQN